MKLTKPAVIATQRGRNPLRSTIAITAAAIFALAGCGGGGSPSPSGGPVLPGQQSPSIKAIPGHSLKLWHTGHVDENTCYRYLGPSFIPKALNKVVRGYKWPHRPGGAEEFIDSLVRDLNSAAAGVREEQNLTDRLLHAAAANAFTTLDFEGPGGPSPSFLTSVIIKGVAHAVDYLKEKNALSQDEMKQIENWIARLLRNAPERGHSLDHKASVYAARLMWSATIGDAAGFSKAQGKLYGILNKLKNRPYFISSMRGNNEVMHHMIYAAYILKVNGVDIFDKKFGSHSLNDAVARHASEVIRNGAKKTRTVNDPTDKPRSILRARGFGTHIAWIPVYLAAKPSGGASEVVRALNDLLRKTDRKPYWGMQIGIHTGCLFGGVLLA